MASKMASTAKQVFFAKKYGDITMKRFKIFLNIRVYISAGFKIDVVAPQNSVERAVLAVEQLGWSLR